MLMLGSGGECAYAVAHGDTGASAIWRKMVERGRVIAATFAAHMLDMHMLHAVWRDARLRSMSPARLHVFAPLCCYSIVECGGPRAPSSPAASIVVFSFPLSPHSYCVQTPPILFAHFIKPSHILCQTSLSSSSPSAHSTSTPHHPRPPNATTHSHQPTKHSITVNMGKVSKHSPSSTPAP